MIPANQDSLPEEHATAAREIGYDVERCLDTYNEYRSTFVARCQEEGWENPRRDGYYILVDIDGVPTLMDGPDDYAWERGRYDPMNLWANACGRIEYLRSLRDPDHHSNVRHASWARRWPWLARWLGDEYTLMLDKIQEQARTYKPFPG